MKKTLKRLLAAITLVMMLSALTIPVFAADEDDWFIGTWCVSDWDSGAAVKLESSGTPGIVNVYQLMISTRSKGNEITKLRGTYQAEYMTDPDGGFVLINPSLPDADGRYFSGIKVFKPEGDSNTLKVVLAPRELTGDEGTEGPATWYRRDAGFLPDNEPVGTESSAEQKSDDSTISVTEAKDDYGYSHDNRDGLGEGSYASDFDDMTPGEVAVASAVAAVVAAGIAAGAAGAAGGGIGKTGSGNGDDGTYVLKDPATGAESLYIYDDATGEWVSDDGRTVLDPSRIAQWMNDRIVDRKAAADTMEKMQNRDTETDRTLKKVLQEEQKQKAEDERRDYINKIGQRHSILSGDVDAINKALGQDQKEAGKLSEKAFEELESANNRVLAAEVVGKAADVAVDAIANYSKPLKPIAYIYYGGRNLTSNLTDAIVNEKDVMSSLRKAAAETIVDITQAGVDKLGYKFAAYTVGDAYKKVLSAIDEGEISADEMTDAAVSGVEDGMKKTLVSAAFKYAEGKFKPTGKVELKTDTAIKNLTKEASGKSAKLLGAYEGGTISKATYDGAKSVLNAKYVAEVRQIRKIADSYVKATEKAAETMGHQYDAASNVLENMAGDVVTGNNPFKRN